MEIVSVRPEHVEKLRAIYLDQVANAPHCCFAPDVAQFEDALFGRVTPSATFFNDFTKASQLTTFVAEDAGTPQGFATLATYSRDDAPEKIHQAITGLFFAEWAAGEALIAACEARATVDALAAFPASHGKTPLHTYNSGWDGLSDRVPMAAQLLSQHGYVPTSRELHLIAPLASLGRPSVPLPTAITLHAQDGATGQLGMQRCQAREGEAKAGICSFSTLALLADDSAASRTGYIWGLYVEEAYRRRGLGRALMVAALNQLSAQGCTACWLTTAADNWGAQALYYSLDFAMVDCSVSFRKQGGV